MTDAEIIKALECCANTFDCRDCPFKDDCGSLQKLSTLTIDLINRKDAEIINRTEEYNDMLEQRNKLEEALDGETVKNMRLGHEVERLMKEQLEKELFEGNHYSFHNGKLCAIPKTEKEQIKSEAYKEFAERLHQKCKKYPYTLPSVFTNIEITYKELTEGGNEQ